MPKTSIIGWGLKNPDPSLFFLEKSNQFEGCIAWGCEHISHDPGEFQYTLSLYTGSLLYLGELCNSPFTYFWKLPDSRYLKHTIGFERHDRVSVLQKIPSSIQLYHPASDLNFYCPACATPVPSEGQYCKPFIFEGSCLI